LFRAIAYLGLTCAVFITMLCTLAIVGLKNGNAPPGANGSLSTTLPASASTVPSATPSGVTGTTLDISTPDDIHYDKNELDVSAGAQVTVRYTNDSNVAHNIDFLSGPDPSAATLAATKIGAGPTNVQTVSFKAPSTPGSYYFHCDVHPTQMNGHLVVR
jgi:plastocyanin